MSAVSMEKLKHILIVIKEYKIARQIFCYRISEYKKSIFYEYH